MSHKCSDTVFFCVLVLSTFFIFFLMNFSHGLAWRWSRFVLLNSISCVNTSIVLRPLAVDGIWVACSCGLMLLWTFFYACCFCFCFLIFWCAGADIYIRPALGSGIAISRDLPVPTQLERLMPGSTWATIALLLLRHLLAPVCLIWGTMLSV